MARGPELGLLRDVVGRRREAAVRLALPDGHEPGLLLGARREGGVRHAQRLPDALEEHLVQAPAGDLLHHLAEPVGVDPVVPHRARVEEQRRVQRRAQARERVGHAGDLVIALEVLAAEPVAVAGGVVHELADGRLGRGRAQPRRVAVEALEHLQLAELGQDARHGLVELEAALLDERERRDGRHRLRHRREAEHRVGRRVARRALVQHAVRARDDRDDAGDRPGVRARGQQLVDPCEAAHLPISPPNRCRGAEPTPRRCSASSRTRRPARPRRGRRRRAATRPWAGPRPARGRCRPGR